jgi:hypothetical protein
MLHSNGLLLSGCASTTIQAQWTDPHFAGQSLRGATVLVVCQAPGTALKRICQDQIATQIAASGVRPVVDPAADYVTATGGPIPDEVFAAARRAGARAIWVSTIVPDATVVSPGPTIGFGLGGFGGSFGRYRSSGVGAGVGVGVPVGGEQVQTAYAADMILTDVNTGQLMWTSRVTTSASQELAEEVAKLAKAGVEAAQQAGFL